MGTETCLWECRVNLVLWSAHAAGELGPWLLNVGFAGAFLIKNLVAFIFPVVFCCSFFPHLTPPRLVTEMKISRLDSESLTQPGGGKSENFCKDLP